MWSVAGSFPLQEMLVSSISLSLVRAHSFCPESDGADPKFGRPGRVMGVGSTSMLSRSFRYSGKSSSESLVWMGLVMSSRAWDSRIRSLAAVASTVVLAVAVAQ